MNLYKIEGLLEAVCELMETGSDVDEAAAAPLLQQIYDEMITKYRPVIHALPSVANVAAKDLVPIVNTFLTLANEVRADESFQAAVATGGVLKAQMRKKALDSYMETGFHRDEAMALVLQDVANAKAHRNYVGNSASSLNKSS